ncbi:MAG: hypothetical protein L3J29_03375 [Cyclobacteriaceae bacterium]|nr:hypothetical protein [Cyclobacteriaceae bacterium]
MIVSKPKPTALIALGVFILICFGVGGYALNNVLNNIDGWFGYTVAFIMLPLAFILLIRQLLSYKTVQVGDVLKVSYPFRFHKKEMRFKELISWKQTIIKTKNDPFKQLALTFENFTLKLSVQENTNYERIYKFLKKRAGKKEIS